MAVFPLGAAIVAAVFGGMLAWRYIRRRRLFEGLWAIALFMYAAASFSMFLGVLSGWTPAEFRVYWLLGAVLNVPYLAMGELYLLLRRQWIAHLLLVALLVGTAFAMGTVRTAPIVHPAELARDLPLGKTVFGDGSAPYRFAQLYSFPAYFLLLGGILWSVYQMRGVPALRDRFYGTLLIAAGATVVAIGSGVGAGLHNPLVFSVALLVGMVLMFAGFLRAGRAPSPQPEPSPSL